MFDFTKDCALIQEKFNKVLKYSQGIPDPNTSDIFAQWYKNKSFFINAFGDLIYEYPKEVVFYLDAKAKKRYLDDFIDYCYENLRNYDLANFLTEEKDYFFDNKTGFRHNVGGHTIPEGTKIIKAFKYFEDNEKALREVQDYASRIIQQNKVSGRLCLSVHPLDFLSASENTHKWRSCHALDGDYRAGNISYMLDNTTIMAYLKSDDEVNLPNFPDDVPWNSKKWRTLFYFSNDRKMIFAGRQYPFEAITGIEKVKNLFREIGLGDFGNWEEISTKYDDKPPVHTMLSLLQPKHLMIGSKDVVALHHLVKNGPGARQYNDILQSTAYIPSYALRLNENIDDNTLFTVGEGFKCLYCNIAPASMTESMMCLECELEYGDSDSDAFGWCSSCGRRYIYETGVWIDSSEEEVCPECADEYVAQCECCRQTVWTNEIYFDRETEEHLCETCYNNRQNDWWI